MWKHEIIYDLQDYTTRESKTDFSEYSALCRSLIENSIHIHAGEWRNYTQGMIGKSINNYEMSPLPYNNILLTYQCEGHRYGTIIYKKPEWDGIKIVLLRYHKGDINKWIPYHYYGIIDTAPGTNNKMTAVVVSRAIAKDVTKDEEDKIYKTLSSRMGFIHAVLVVLNCKNISLQPIDPPERLNKKRLKNGKLPLYRYHVLTIDVSKARKLAGKAPIQNVGIMPVHLCRGHFKEYTAEKPLFGHITGRFWWQPFARGKTKNGIIAKDYEIKTE